MLLLSLLLSAPSQARDWPRRSVEADVVLPRAGLELSLDADTRITSGERDVSGTYRPWTDGTRWTRSVLWLGVAHGLSDAVSIDLRIPTVRASLTTGSGQTTQTTGLGDVELGAWMQPWRGRVWGLAGRLGFKLPSGSSWPSDTTGDPGAISGFLTGTGTTDVSAGVQAHVRAGRVARLEGGGAWVTRLPALVGYAISEDGAGNAWFDPGDMVQAGGRLLIQPIDAAALGGAATFKYILPSAVGAAGPGSNSLQLTDVPFSGGSFLDVEGQLVISPSARLEIGGAGGLQVVGADTTRFAHLGLQALSPQPGVQIRGWVTARW